MNVVVDDADHSEPITIESIDVTGILHSSRNELSIRHVFAHHPAATCFATAQRPQLGDVFIESFRPGVAARLGLGRDALCAGHPELIYCSITGFGQTGPDASRAGYDFMIQGTGGLMSITGERDGVSGAGPQKVGVAMADLDHEQQQNLRKSFPTLNHRKF